MVVLPTPPLPLPIATTCATPGKGCGPCGVLVPARGAPAPICPIAFSSANPPSSLTVFVLIRLSQSRSLNPKICHFDRRRRFRRRSGEICFSTSLNLVIPLARHIPQTCQPAPNDARISFFLCVSPPRISL